MSQPNPHSHMGSGSQNNYPDHQPQLSEVNHQGHLQSASESFTIASDTSKNRSSTIVYVSPRQSSALGKWFRQLGVVCRLNCILLVRYWKAAILQAIILPLLAVGIVYAIQQAASSDNGKIIVGDSRTTTWTMDGIHQCTVRESKKRRPLDHSKKKLTSLNLIKNFFTPL